MINGKEFLLPLGVAKRIEDGRYLVDEFNGSSFFVNGQGWVATCKHNLPDLSDDRHYTCHYLVDESIHELNDIRRHPRMDLAVGRVELSGGYLTPHLDRLLLGIDVCAMGFVKRGIHEGKLKVDIRFLKGYVTRVGPNDFGLPTGPTLLEVSFPSLPGFSGAPLLTDTNQLLGMLYGNLESTIEVYSTKEVADADGEFRESIYRVVELGLAHPLDQLEQGVRDLGISLGARVA